MPALSLTQADTHPPPALPYAPPQLSGLLSRRPGGGWEPEQAEGVFDISGQPV